MEGWLTPRISRHARIGMRALMGMVFLLSALLGVMMPAYAQETTPEKFDHFATGFPLVGIHATTPCESCHIRGVLKGTPKLCAGCHNNVIAPGLSVEHIPTNNQPCDTCHTPQSFMAAGSFNHNSVSAMRCDACHNGAFASSGAIGKTPNHPRTNPGQDCHDCHNTVAFAGAGFDHTGITSGCNSCHLKDRPANHIPVPPGSECILCHRVQPDTFDQAALFNHGEVRSMRCDACHNGGFTAFGAPGKTPNHPPTQPGQDCHDCHNTTDFAGANFDHAGVTTGCARCHQSDLPANHLPRPAGSECYLCHMVPPPDTFGEARNFNHSNLTAMRCDACHNGAFINSGAPGKTPNHPPTQPGQDCNVCHKTTTTFADPDFDHTGLTGGCNRCHLNDVPTTHIPRPAASECILCHRVKPDTWTNAATFNHALVTAMRCDACHSGQFNGSGAQGKTASHIPTPAGSDCSTCHVARSAGGGWALTSPFNHALVSAMRCDTCHNGQFNGAGAQGKSAAHFPTPAGSDCGVCHVARSAGAGWTLATPFSHALVSSMTCSQCHSGAFTATGAVGKGTGHITTTNNCEKCHVTTDWAATITPLDHTQVLGSCNGCHLADLSPNHLPRPAASDCGACHTNPPPVWTQATKFNHSLVTAMRCDACHNGTFTASGAVGKNVGHIPTAAGQDCGSCHRVPPDSFALATSFNHNSVTTLRCSQCHNGQFAAAGAVGKGPNHFVTTAECDRCHTIAPGWPSTVATFRHQSANYPGDHNATVACIDCHTGNTEAATWRNAALRPFCAGCHERDFVPGPHDRTQTPATDYTATELKDCTGACHVYATTVGGTIARTRNGPEHRVNAGGF